MTGDEHLAWAKERALDYADSGDWVGAVNSLTSDLGKHPETAGHPSILRMTSLAAAGDFAEPGKLREFIEGVQLTGQDAEAGDAELLTYEQAVALLPDGDRIHTILDSGVALLGADWDRQQVLDLLARTDRREVTGPAAQSMRHGLAAWLGGEPVFIATKST